MYRKYVKMYMLTADESLLLQDGSLLGQDGLSKALDSSKTGPGCLPEPQDLVKMASR